MKMQRRIKNEISSIIPHTCALMHHDDGEVDIIMEGALYLMSQFLIKEIETEQELRDVLRLCYRILGESIPEIYGYAAWRERFLNGMQPLVYAIKDNKIVSAVLWRAENPENITIGFVACHENYRRQGITKALMHHFEDCAKKQGYQYVTLGSHADVFYEKCGYHKIFEINGQNIYQKEL